MKGRALSKLVVVALMGASMAGPALAQEPPLADFFGFSGLEVVKIGRNAGPILTEDMNGDGLTDLIAVNNSTSRIELHYQKKNASPTDEITPPSRVNEFPEHWRFRREFVSVTHEVQGVLAHDFDGDGLMDLIYGGDPPEIVFVRQSAPGVFGMTRRHQVKNLSAHRNALAVADVLGDSKPELLAIAEGKINIWPLNGDQLGQPVVLASGTPMVAFALEDYNGDDRTDIIGIIPDDAAPIRLWLGSSESGQGKLGGQIRFEMPPLIELEPVRLPKQDPARIAVIERQSKRIVVYETEKAAVDEYGDRDAAYNVISFTDPGNRKRDTTVVDVNGDGLLDLIATDTESNSIVVYRQLEGKGLQRGESYPSLSALDFIAAGNVDSDKLAEIFVMSEKEGVVGRSDVMGEADAGVPFPKPLSIPDGNTPVAMNLVQLEHGPHLAVVAKSGRDYMLYLIEMDGDREAISLGSQSRNPETILALDADQDGKTDLLLFTRDKPMTMLRAEASETEAASGEEAPNPTTASRFKLMESKDMGQFGLVQAANAQNTAVMDMDGNGKPELLIADKNYVRAVRYETNPAPGVSPGWQVIRQINANDSASKLVALALLGNRIIAADEANSRLVVMGKDDDVSDAGPAWKQLESLIVRGFKFNTLFAGPFAGDRTDNILAVGDDGFAIVRLGGEAVRLKQAAAWRTDQDRRRQHELTSGDVNNDGFVDLVSLDAGEQMCEIFTFTEARHMLYATSFRVFESKIFSGGEPREYEPSECVIADITGDGSSDVILLSHDRVLIYPQMNKAEAQAAR